MAHGRHGFGFWAVMALAVVMVLFGLPILGGGVWLIGLGGSWYYALAGLGLLASAYFLFRRDIAGVGIYLVTFVGTLVWALWERGFDGWAQVPRLVAPTVILILVLLTVPALKGRRKLAPAAFAGAAVSVLALGVSLMMVTGTFDAKLVAQEAPAAPAPAQPAAPFTPPADIPQAEPAVPAVTYANLEPGEDWYAYGGSSMATRYSPLDQITPDNVAELEVAWEFRTGDLPEADEALGNQNTPIKIGDRLYLCSALNKISALDAASGTEFWTYDPQVSRDAIGYNASCRGLVYYADPAAGPTDMCATRVVINTLDARMIAVDAQTGQLCPDFGNGGVVNLMDGMGESAPGFYSPTSPPTLVRDVLVVGSQVSDGQTREAPSGVIRGYNVLTGGLDWAWDMGRPGETGLPPEGEVYTPGTPNSWTIASGDDELGVVYIPMGNSAVDYWGGDRSPQENQYSTAIVALNVEDGSVRWFYQTVHYDVWDYDLGSQGTLVDFPTEAGPVPAIIMPTKQGQFFIFDRSTGEALVNIEEQAVPQGGVEPERLSPMQPHVTDFPNQLKPDIEEKSMWGMTPLDQLWCRIQFRQASYQGPYTPPTVNQPWIQYPGYNGGSDWGGIAVDKGRNILVSNYNDTANYNQLIPRETIDEMGVVPMGDPNYGQQGSSHDGVSPQALTPFGIRVNAGWRVPGTGMLCKEPPYGGIMAIDLDTRQVLWDKPFGSAQRNGPFGIPSMLPLDIGTPNNGGTAVTASGLIFVAATTDNFIRAIGTETGEVLWQAELPAGGQATPMVYETKGRQFVVINAGGHDFMETPIGDYFIAYALPEVEGQ